MDRSKRNQHEVNESLSISIYNSNTSSESFLYSQYLIDYLLHSKPKSTDKTKLIEFCQQKYSDIVCEHETIEDFRLNYSSQQALDWYMKDSFIYRLFHRVVHYQNLDLLYLLRFFIQDIRDALNKYPISSSINVYRSQLMTQDEISLLTSSLHAFISINSFLSTSIHKQLALVFLQQAHLTSDLERVLLEIHIDSTVKSSKTFGFIQSNNTIRQTEEVVFSLGSIFRLNNIEQQQDGLWIVRLALCGDQEKDLKDLFQFNEFSFGKCLHRIGNLNEAEKFFAHLLSESANNNPMIQSECYYELGCLAMDKNMIDLSLDWHEKSLEIKESFLNEDNISLAHSYNKLGQIYMKKNDYRQALSLFLRTLKISLPVQGENHADIAECYTNLGGIYQKQKNFNHALECYQKALRIRKRNSSDNNTIDLGIAYNNLAIIYSCRKQYDLAFEHYEKALKILEKTLSSSNPELAVCYCGLGLINEQREKFELALAYYGKTATIYREIFAPTHPDVVQIEQHIQRILSKLIK